MRPEVLWATLPQRLGYAFREGCLRGHRPTHGRSALALSALWLPLKFRLLKLQNNLNHIVLAHLNTNCLGKFTTDVLFPNQDNFWQQWSIIKKEEQNGRVHPCNWYLYQYLIFVFVNILHLYLSIIDVCICQYFTGARFHAYNQFHKFTVVNENPLPSKDFFAAKP